MVRFVQCTQEHLILFSFEQNLTKLILISAVSLLCVFLEYAIA